MFDLTKGNGYNGINIYLAGKISANDWRHTIVPDLRDTCLKFGVEGLPDNWPILRHGIAPNRHYVGPYFIGCDHGCYHGKDSHGFGPGCSGDIEEFPGETYDNHCPTRAKEQYVVKQCHDAIDRADVVFAWIDDLTAFGTIFELGYAVGRKQVYLASPDEVSNDLWFMRAAIEATPNSHLIYENGPIEAFAIVSDILTKNETIGMRRSRTESPIESNFYDAMQGYCYGGELEPQIEINANGHRYRADFAIPSKKIVIELDGHEYHKSKEQRTNDARRERDLQTAGWKVIRFTGTEVHRDAYKCAEDACHFIRSVET